MNTGCCDEFDVGVSRTGQHGTHCCCSTSLQCAERTSSARSKLPPPICRTSSVTSTTSPMMLLRSPTANDRRLAAAAPPSPSRVQAIVDGRSPSLHRATAQPSVRVTSAPRRSLSTAYADLCQTPNDQLAAGGDAVARRPGASRSAAVDGAMSPDIGTSAPRG